ncbi:hypothetical protein C4546_03745 [Candidatus Parcubacteria bacterium]|jgi:uncharacterized Zn finger protein|nr:MAG: hypothetical protein C4546_03745 [Candidatus Parcubacteria bacterium]
MPQFALPNFSLPNGKSDNLRMDGHCPNCGNLFDFRKTQVLAEEANSTLLFLKCSNCGVAAVATMSMSPQGLLFRGLVTDLTAPDVMKFKDAEEITSDDVVTVHQALNSNSLIN